MTEQISGHIRLLVVDDETRFLKTLAERLTLRDFDVTAVSSGQEALKAASENDFELAIVDLKMPGMRGEEVLEALKADHPFLEVVILTGHGSVQSAVECVQAGSYQYLQKPCETEELLAVLMKAYAQRVRRKLAHDTERLAEIERIASGESPLGILRKLRELELKDKPSKSKR